MRMWHIILTRWKLILSNRWQFVFMLILPLVVFWTAEQLLKQGSDELKVPVIMVNEENDETVQTIIERVKQNKTLRVMEHSKTTALEMLERNQAEAAVLFTKNLAEQLKQGKIKNVIHLYEAPNAISTGLIEEFVASEVIRLASNGKAATYLDEEFNGDKLYEYAWKYTDQQWEPQPLMTVSYELDGQSVAAEKQSSDGSTLLFGLLSIYILLINFYLQDWVLTERRSGIASRTRMLGVSKLTRYISNLVGTSFLLLLTLLPVSLYLLIGFTDFFQKGWMIAGYLFACIGISFFIANLFTEKMFYHLTAVAFTIVTGILGGSFIKLEEFSGRLMLAAEYTPQHWLLSGLISSDSGTNLYILFFIGLGLIIFGLGIGVVRHDRN
ncbi:ABC transporter permease [Pseudalkalibacillus sp. Hm43]|uniref:ABC transporter permease n=1 Tax=Pseudalkalibacillus sp. Hm43 TaxID=3450742 RepID=UPI003F442F6F